LFFAHQLATSRLTTLFIWLLLALVGVETGIAAGPGRDLSCFD